MGTSIEKHKAQTRNYSLESIITISRRKPKRYESSLEEEFADKLFSVFLELKKILRFCPDTSKRAVIVELLKKL